MTEFSELSDSCYAHLKYYINYQKKKKKKKNTYSGQFSVSVFSEVLNKRLAASLRMSFPSLLLQTF